MLSLNLAAKLVFLAKGIHPRTWWERKKGRRAMLRCILEWILSLVLLVAPMFVRSPHLQ